MTKNPKKTITRADLVQKLADRCSLSSKRAQDVVDLFFLEITTALTQGKMVALRRFGFFKPKGGSAYMARNPRRGQTVKVASKKRVSFKVSAIFVKNLSQGTKR